MVKSKTTKKQFNFRASAHTVAQLTALVESLGLNTTEIITLAVDRLYVATTGKEASPAQPEQVQQ